MKLIIDIPEEEYKMRVLWAKSDNLCSPDTIWIAKGLPYEKNEEGPQGDLSEAIKTIKAVCKDHNTCITCPMNWNCNEHPEKWEEMRGGTV